MEYVLIQTMFLVIASVNGPRLHISFFFFFYFVILSFQVTVIGSILRRSWIQKRFRYELVIIMLPVDLYCFIVFNSHEKIQ